MRKIIYLIALVGSVSCTQSQNNSNKHIEVQNANVNFDTLINHIAIRMIDLTAPGGLSRIDDFLLIYNHPTLYFDDAKRCISSDDYPDLKKRICIYSMQKLSLVQYLDFTEYCLAEFNSGQLSERTLYLVVFPTPWETDIRFAESYNQKEVKNLFEKMLSNKKLSEASKSGIRYASSGEMIKMREGMKN